MSHYAILQKLNAAGIKPSMQRIAIMEYLDMNHTHPTVDEIYRFISSKHPTLSRTTVYNTVKILAAHGCINTIDIEAANTRYDADTTPHAHFLCTRCGKITDIPLDGRCTLPEGFTASAMQVYFKGICPGCHATETNNQSKPKSIKNNRL